ncbi:MAG: hypothetical protein LBS94_03965 [Prevotellaceae bacterium]|nr:hypothetical protein [Prevotellaceae bacterium]
MTNKVYAAILAAMMAAPVCGWAQSAEAADDGLKFSAGADVVSSYVWRGAYCAGLSAQPSLGLEWKGVSLGAWGSVDLLGYKELDFALGYSIAGFDITVTDYWWSGEDAYDYFSRFDDNLDGAAIESVTTSKHMFEAALAYTLPIEKFPLKLAWSTFFAGYDYKLDDDLKPVRAFSSYVELSLPFTVKSVELEAALGVRPFKSPIYESSANQQSWYSSDFAVVNLSLKASKEIKITDSFSLPLFTQLIFNPNAEDVFLVVGLSF